MSAVSPPRFHDASHLRECHAAMFGEVGELAAGFLLKHAETLFDVPIDPLALRVVAAPLEMGGYNRHAGYAAPDAGLILMNRHYCELRHGGIALSVPPEQLEDFIVHELPHMRQRQILDGGGIARNASRGSHRDAGWYGAVMEAAPRYLGVQFPPSIWPAWKSVRDKGEGRNGKVRKVRAPGTLDEKDVTHWPGTFRALARAGQLVRDTLGPKSGDTTR